MLQNPESHANCICFNDNRNTIIELKEFARETIGKIELCAQEIIFVLRGDLQVTVENNYMTGCIREGEFVFMPVRSKLSCKLSPGSSILIARLTGEIPECHVFRINKMSGQMKDLDEGIYTLKINERMDHFLSGLLSTMGDGLKCKQYMQMEIGRMLYLIHAYYTREECLRFFSPITSPDVGFSEFVRLNHSKFRTIGEMASAMNMTNQQFANHFRKVFGQTPREWLQNQKAQNIYRDICKSNKSFKEIALEYDFQQSNFFRYCRMKFGESPSAIRRSLSHIDLTPHLP